MSTETKTLTNADAKIQPKLGVKALVQIGMLSAIAVVLMMFDIPLPFAPTFYKIDLSGATPMEWRLEYDSEQLRTLGVRSSCRTC